MATHIKEKSEELTLSKQLRKLLNENLDSSYIVFGFEGRPDLAADHVTLMYFGKIEDSKKAEILGMIEDYMMAEKPQKFEATFSKVSMFGKNKDIRVLEADRPELFLPRLRALLEPFNGSEFKEYNPHYTTENVERASFIVDRIQFSESEYQELKTWKLA